MPFLLRSLSGCVAIHEAWPSHSPSCLPRKISNLHVYVLSALFSTFWKLFMPSRPPQRVSYRAELPGLVVRRGPHGGTVRVFSNLL